MKTQKLFFFLRMAVMLITMNAVFPALANSSDNKKMGMPFRPVQSSEFHYTIANDLQTSDKKLEFDLYLLDIDPSVYFELSGVQSAILVNSAIINGGVLTASVVPGTSELVDLQVPNAITYESGSPNGCIKIASRIPPGCGNGSIIGTTGLGTRVCRVRLTNTVPFTAGSTANLTFNFTISPYPTKVFQYTGTPCLGVELACDASNCYSLASNVVLNPPPTLNVTPPNQTVTSDAGTTAFNVSSNSAWTVQSNQTWCAVNHSGFGNGVITANYQENTSTETRIANITVTVSGLTPLIVTVTQLGTSASLYVYPSYRNVSYSAGTTDFNVTTTSAWTAQSDAPWCSVTPSGTGSGLLIATYGSNTMISPRTANITVSGQGTSSQIVSVYQDGMVSVPALHRKDFGIYPNPSDGKITIRMSDSQRIITGITIRNLQGQVVLDHSFSSSTKEYTADLSSENSGVYFITILTESDAITQKLIINNQLQK